MVVKSASLYQPMFKQTFPVIFLFLLFQELVSVILSDSSLAHSLFSPLVANIIVSLINFFCSVFLMGYLMSEAYSAVHRQKGLRNSHLAFTAKNFARLMGVALVQSLAIFAVIAFYTFLSNLVSLDKLASQEIMVGFFGIIAFLAYTFVSQIPPLVLFKQMGLWEAFMSSFKTVKSKLFLSASVMLLNITILLLPGLLLFTLLDEVLKIESVGVQQVIQIFLSTALMPLVHLMWMHFFLSVAQKYKAACFAKTCDMLCTLIPPPH
jgi:hypothetical protein